MSLPRRVLMINDSGRPDAGAELQILALREGLRARGYQARLFSSDAELVPGLPLLADRSCRGGGTGAARVLLSTHNPGAVRALRAELAEYPPDLVHIRSFLWQLPPTLVPLLRDVPLLFQAVSYKAICPNGQKMLPDGSSCTHAPGLACLRDRCVMWPVWAGSMVQIRLLERYRDAIDHVAAQSPRMAAILAANGWPETGLLTNGVDERPARAPLGKTPVVAFAGRLYREKGVGWLIAAFRRVAERRPEARLWIAGSGPEEARLRAQAEGCEQIEFLGHLARDEMERRFDAAWVQVVPSLWHEPFGNVATEAMMRGTAVIVSDAGGLPDLVAEGETGLVVPPGDQTALADAIDRILSDRGRAEAMGRAGRGRALAEYSRAASLDRLEATYEVTMASFAAKRGDRRAERHRQARA